MEMAYGAALRFPCEIARNEHAAKLPAAMKALRNCTFRWFGEIRQEKDVFQVSRTPASIVLMLPLVVHSLRPKQNDTRRSRSPEHVAKVTEVLNEAL